MTVEIAHFREVYANIKINEPSTSRSFHLNFEEQDIPRQQNLV